MSDDIAFVVRTRTLVQFVAIVAIALLLFYLRDVLVTVFVAAVLSAAIDPSIVWLEQRGLPRMAALFIIVLGIVALFVAVLVTFVPLALDQGQQFAANIPDFYQRNLQQLRDRGYDSIATAIQNGVHTASQQLGPYMRSFFGGALTALRGIVSAFGIVVLTFYMAMQQQVLKSTALDFTPPAARPRVVRILRTIKVRLGQWLRGQLLLGAVIGGMSYLGLLILHVKFALVLALLAGLTEMIPIIGPIAGAIPAILVAASDEPVRGLYVAALYVLIQQSENHILVPRVMSSTTGLNPITVLVALLVGARLAGIVGVLLAVPASLIVMTLIEDWRAQRTIPRALPAPADVTPPGDVAAGG
jgi:predicted PurR-regulated permease PerM